MTLKPTAEIARTALEALRFQLPLFDLQSLTTTFQHLKWRERIKNSFGYDPLQCLRCGRTLELVEIWEPKRGHPRETFPLHASQFSIILRLRNASPNLTQSVKGVHFDFVVSSAERAIVWRFGILEPS